MLFNSFEFIFLFMPLILAGYYLIGRKSHSGAIAWLTAASLFFYAYWSLYSLPVLCLSIFINYILGKYLSNEQLKFRRPLIVLAVTINLFALGYYKYANFFIENTNALRALLHLQPLHSLDVALPLGISFFTFTQIAFLLDSYYGKVKEKRLLDYTLFVSFFPHLIAGPVIHHKQMMPQFSDSRNLKFDDNKFALGILLFTIGLAKKLLLADPLGEYANVLFDGVEAGATPQAMMSWLGSISYSFQLYFDFSGYSDMAIGLSLFFGILLPLNFDAPFKATSIIDFWQRWHMTLTRYIGEYLYSPITLSMMRLGQGRQPAIDAIFSLVLPTTVIFLILGLWHGPKWTYVIFGGMHGLYIVINHLWRKRFPIRNHVPHGALNYRKTLGWLLTFLAVNASFVVFRSDSVPVAAKILEGMLGLNNGFYLDPTYQGNVLANIAHSAWQSRLGIGQKTAYSFELIVIAFIIVTSFASTASITRASAEKSYFIQRKWGGIVLGVLFVYSVMQIGKTSPFLYFQF